MPSPAGVEVKEFIHEGCLSEQRYGKFAKRWVVLDKCKTSGCIYLSVYRFSEDEANPVEANLKYHYILSEYEFIGTIKGRLSSNRNSSFYWAIILKSEILQFQNKSLFVCENWNSKIRENINYFNWEVRTGSGFKSTNQEAILFLTDYLLAVCYSDLSKVLCAIRLEDIVLFYSDRCCISFRSMQNGETNTYEVEALRNSQAALIVEEVQARKNQRKDSQDTERDLSKAQPVVPVPIRKESFQVDDIYGSEDFLSHTGRPLVTPPSTPGSRSPYMSSSPSVSPCPSPTSRRHIFGSEPSPVPAPRPPSLSLNKIKNVGNKLKVPGDHTWERRNAIRSRTRRKTAPNIMLSPPVERSPDGNSPAVPERPAWTLRPTSHHLSLEQYERESRPVDKSRSLGGARFQAMKSVGCAVCVEVCSCIIRGPVLPLPINRPQENNSDSSSLSSMSGSREDFLPDISEVCTTTLPSSNRSSLKVDRSRSRSLSPRGFLPENVPPPVPEHGLVCERKSDRDSIDKLGKLEAYVTNKPRIPERPENKSSFVNNLHQQKETRKPPVAAYKDCHRQNERTFSHNDDGPPISQRPPVVPRRTVSLSGLQLRTCVVCNGPCECNQNELSLMSFMNSETIEENEPYVRMEGNVGGYLSMEGNFDLYLPSTDFTSTSEVGQPNDSMPFGELGSQKKPLPRVGQNGKPIPAPRQETLHNNQFVESISRNQRLSSDSAGGCNVGPILPRLQQSSKKEFTKSFDDLYQLANQDREESKCDEFKSRQYAGKYSQYVNLNGGRVKYTRMSLENGGTCTGKTLFQLLFEYISKKSIPIDNLKMKPSVWTHFLISFDCEQCENELKDWRGLAELMGLSANDMKIVEEQCRKSSRISSEFIMLYWANMQKPFLLYTRQNLLDILQNLDRMDLVEIIQNKEIIG